MKKSVAWTRACIALAVGLAALGLWGCPNPNAIGVQQYGSVKVVCLQAGSQQPVIGAIVSAPGPQTQVTETTDASGAATFPQVVIGTHTITADAPGLHGEATATIIENTTIGPIQILMSPTT